MNHDAGFLIISLIERFPSFKLNDNLIVFFHLIVFTSERVVVNSSTRFFFTRFDEITMRHVDARPMTGHRRLYRAVDFSLGKLLVELFSGESSKFIAVGLEIEEIFRLL